ncbi:hypothetical protein AB835_07080 [Candidatus Endobugula sertula]|uniref:Uncharacterized protein n=1 Tax=Candidatus Endobugula sertula TaxID=62101 RepID=A0A1D2QQC3_9GAMM|nr:hypothetical protein AB835_07080 [Candidatus Endobugula sertula]
MHVLYFLLRHVLTGGVLQGFHFTVSIHSSYLLVGPVCLATVSLSSGQMLMPKAMPFTVSHFRL